MTFEAAQRNVEEMLSHLGDTTQMRNWKETIVWLLDQAAQVEERPGDDHGLSVGDYR